MNIEALWWYCEVRNLPFKETDTFDNFILIIHKLNKDIKNGKCIDKYRVVF